MVGGGGEEERKFYHPPNCCSIFAPGDKAMGEIRRLFCGGRKFIFMYSVSSKASGKAG